MKRLKFLKLLTVIGVSACVITTPLMLAGCDDAENAKIKFVFDYADSTKTDLYVSVESGEENSVVPPALEEVNGFAGIWEKVSEENNTITYVSKYGTGEESNPYLVSTVEQMKRVFTEFSTESTTKFYRVVETDEVETTEAEATIKVVSYDTVDIRSTRADVAEAWTGTTYTASNTIYFKLLNDIDFSGLRSNEDISGGIMSINIDGNGKSLLGVDGANFATTAGTMFDRIVDSKISDLTINSRNNLATIADVATGNVLLENITTTATSRIYLDDAANDRNTGAFVNYVLGDAQTNVVFRGCVNNVDIYSLAWYNGIFVGGYAKSPCKVSFENCVNNGDFTSFGHAGVFFGNNATNIATDDLTIVNCSNNGVISASASSHILCPVTGGTGFDATRCASLDQTVVGTITVGENTLLERETLYSVSAGDTDETEHNIYVTANGEEVIDLDKYEYIITLSDNVSYKSGGTKTGSFRLELNFAYNTENGDSVSGKVMTFNDIFYEMYTKSAMVWETGELDGKDVTANATGGDLYFDYTKVVLDKTFVNYIHNTLHTTGYEGLYVIDDSSAIIKDKLYTAGHGGNSSAVMYCTLTVKDKETGEIREIVSVNLNSYNMEADKAVSE